MSIFEKNSITTFSELRKGVPFSVQMPIYCLTENREIIKKHFLYKKSNNKAITTDRRIIVHLLPDSPVVECYIDLKKRFPNTKQGGKRNIQRHA